MTPTTAPLESGCTLAESGAELTALLGGTALEAGPSPIRGAVVDSRLVSAHRGAAFFALAGARTDGRLHARAAIEEGAAAVIAAAPSDVELASTDGLATAWSDAAVSAHAAGASLIVVRDPVEALAAAATAWRRRFDLEVIGITGSVGKTSTKQFVAAALGGEAAHCVATPGNANNEIGLPLALLNLPDGTEHFVAEMGMYTTGDIRDLCVMAQPRIGIVTAVDAVHAERAGSLDAIELAKGELVESLPTDGCAILAIDDPRVARMANRSRARVMTLGYADGADVQILKARLDSDHAHTQVRLRTPEGEIDVDLPVFGVHFAQAAGLAIAAAMACGVPAERAATRLASAAIPGGRAAVRHFGGIRVLDDTYNAAPSSMFAALATLAACGEHRYAALGAMGELGSYADAAHRAVGQRAAASGLALLIVLGVDADGIAEGAREGGMPIERILRLPADEAGLDAAAGMLGDRAASGDTILVKASRAAQLERLVTRLASTFGTERP